MDKDEGAPMRRGLAERRVQGRGCSQLLQDHGPAAQEPLRPAGPEASWRPAFRVHMAFPGGHSPLPAMLCDPLGCGFPLLSDHIMETQAVSSPASPLPNAGTLSHSHSWLQGP